jgi:hypothetical protein
MEKDVSPKKELDVKRKKTELFRDELKGIYRCVICECLLMDMADDQITVRTKEDLLTEGDLERIHFDISATIKPEHNEEEIKAPVKPKK